MSNLVAAVLGVVLVVAALMIGITSDVPDAIARQRVEVEGSAGYAAIRSAADAFRVANRGATLAGGTYAPRAANSDLGPYLPVPPSMPEGLSWSVSGGAHPFACASGQSPTRQQVDGLARLASRLAGGLGPSCGSTGATTADGPVALTIPL